MQLFIKGPASLRCAKGDGTKVLRRPAPAFGWGSRALPEPSGVVAAAEIRVRRQRKERLGRGWEPGFGVAAGTPNMPVFIPQKGLRSSADVTGWSCEVLIHRILASRISPFAPSF